jgi:hypothetical protein
VIHITSTQNAWCVGWLGIGENTFFGWTQKVAAMKGSFCVFEYQQCMTWLFTMTKHEGHLQALRYAIASNVSIDVTLFPRMT